VKGGGETPFVYSMCVCGNPPSPSPTPSVIDTGARTSARRGHMYIYIYIYIYGSWLTRSGFRGACALAYQDMSFTPCVKVGGGFVMALVYTYMYVCVYIKRERGWERA